MQTYFRITYFCFKVSKMNPAGSQIGQKIKKLRELRNFTQQHMAEELGLSQSAYSKLEMGESEITYNKLERVAEVLGMKPEELITFNESMVFNVMHNQTGQGFVINNNQLSEAEKTLYLQQIELLKDEVNYLKRLLEQVLLRESRS
jgi:transcriptional regulator with XRE-family HTH domain